MARRSDADLLGLARVAALITATVLVAFMVVIDSLGRLIFNPTFHVSEALFFSLVTVWLALLGIESANLVRVIRGNGNGRKEGGDDPP